MKDKEDVFLTATWENLIHITYKVNKDKLYPYLPPNVDLELYGGDALVSLVAFNFKNTSVKGVPIPFYGNFPEVNLRFYAEDKLKKFKGVVFIRELIPRAAIAFAANALYKEHYKTLPVKNQIQEGPDTIKSNYSILVGNSEYTIDVTSRLSTITPQEHSIEHLVKQRDAGFGRSKDGRALIYKVEHALWETYPLITFSLNMDYGKIFGKDWKFLDDEEPLNVMMAKGSDVKVFEWRYYK